AAEAQKTKADVRLGYTELHAPINGIVDVRAVRQGEVVNSGEPVLTLINPDDLWIRIDVEETYIDRIRLGDTVQVRLPSGDTRKGHRLFAGGKTGPPPPGAGGPPQGATKTLGGPAKGGTPGRPPWGGEAPRPPPGG